MSAPGSLRGCLDEGLAVRRHQTAGFQVQPFLAEGVQAMRQFGVAVGSLLAVLLMLRGGLVSPCPLVAQTPEQPLTMFVEQGVPRLVRDDGQEMARHADYLECSGPGNMIIADRLVGSGDFHIGARLSILDPRGSAASFAINRTSHFGFGGPDGTMFLEGRFFVGRGPSVSIGAQADFFQPGRPMLFEVIRKADEITFLIDGKLAHRMKHSGAELGLIGLRPHRATMRISEFWARGQLDPLPARTQPVDYTTALLDLAGDTQRQVVVARGTADVYHGHPTTLLMGDGRTMFAVWTWDHGGHCGPLARSDDAGLTWSGLLNVPDNWREVRNCPTIHRLTDPHGNERLFVLAGNGDMHQSVSEDGGRTWTPMRPNGLKCVVAPITIVPIAGGKHLAHYHWPGRQGGRSRLEIWQSLSSDGGLTWEPGVSVAAYPGGDPCEPATIRSPDGSQLASLMRENSRRFNSLLIVSHDEGRTWSKPVELPASLTGDRHMPRYTADGRLVITFRDMALRSATRGHFVAWVGTYDDIVNLREGQYRILLLRHHGYDSGYGGLERLPDGTLVATTYCALAPGERPSIVSVRFTMQELDALAAGGAHNPPSGP